MLSYQNHVGIYAQLCSSGLHELYELYDPHEPFIPQSCEFFFPVTILGANCFILPLTLRKFCSHNVYLLLSSCLLTSKSAS